MEQSEIFIRILLTIIFGAILGLETETRQIETKGQVRAEKESKQKIGGVRTYTVLSMFGGLAGIYFLAGLDVLVYIFFLTVIAFTLTAYFLNVQFKKAFGLTTEIAIIITFALGFMTTSNVVSLQIIFLIIVLLTFFLSQKQGIAAIIQRIRHKEVIDLLKFSLISVVILPLLPNHNFILNDIVKLIDSSIIIKEPYANIVLINPFQVWLLVVLISGINLAGYVLSKFLGKNKAIFFSGIFGGLVSSTSTTISLAIKSKQELDKNTSKVLAGVGLISNSISFISISILLFITNKELFKELTPIMLIIFISGILIGVYLVNNKGKNLEIHKRNLELKYQPFSIGPALKFVGLIILIKFVIQTLQILEVSRPIFILISSLSGLTGMDAAVIAFGELVNNSAITLSTGILAFMISNYINFAGKSIYSLMWGNKKFFIYLSLGLLLVGILSFLGILI